MEQPYHLSDYWARYLLSPVAWSPNEKLAELSGVSVLLECSHGTKSTVALSVDDVRKHIPEFLSRVHINALVHGNMSKDVRAALHLRNAMAETPLFLRTPTALSRSPKRLFNRGR